MAFFIIWVKPIWYTVDTVETDMTMKITNLIAMNAETKSALFVPEDMNITLTYVSIDTVQTDITDKPQGWRVCHH